MSRITTRNDGFESTARYSYMHDEPMNRTERNHGVILSWNEPRSSNILRRKIAVLGFMGVGKTAVSTNFVDGFFTEKYVPTIRNTFETAVHMNKCVSFFFFFPLCILCWFTHFFFIERISIQKLWILQGKMNSLHFRGMLYQVSTVM